MWGFTVDSRNKTMEDKELLLNLPISEQNTPNSERLRNIPLKFS